MPKHFVYIQYGCGIQSEACSSLNNDIITSHKLRSTPKTPKSTPDLQRCIKVSEPILCSSTTHQGAKTCIHSIRMWDTFKEGLQPQPLHDNILKAQPCPISIFPKIHCRPHMYYSIRVHPNTHPQHIKVLKHFVYIWYGYELLSTEVWSLNNDIITSYDGLSPAQIFEKTWRKA